MPDAPADGTGPVPDVPAPCWSLREAAREDLLEIAEAELVLFPDEAWDVFMLAEEIGHADRRYVVVREDAETGREATGSGHEAPATGHRTGTPARGADGSGGGDGPLLGYAGIMLAGDVADLHTIGTLRPGRGIGRAMLGWCEEAARDGGAERMMLEVREDNERARAFYDRAGFAAISRRRGYYRTATGGMDAIIMSKDLG
jgi:ribosomal-protein-alanine N-acetyltransferase